MQSTWWFHILGSPQSLARVTRTDGPGAPVNEFRILISNWLIQVSTRAHSDQYLDS
jgi:hypothetical protein